MTALQELISKLESIKTELTEKYNGDPLVTVSINIAIKEANKLILSEQLQIIHDYNHGCLDTLKDKMKQGIEYYNETYKQ